jgi:hypothetical protein
VEWVGDRGVLGGIAAISPARALRARRVSVGLVAVLAAACSTDASPPTETRTVTVTSSPTSEPSPTPEPSPESGWTTEQEEEAAASYASGIRKKHSLVLRLQVGRCVVDEVQKEMWPTYDEWAADHDDPGSVFSTDFDQSIEELGIMGRCELRLGV